MAIFNSFLYVYRRVQDVFPSYVCWSTPLTTGFVRYLHHKPQKKSMKFTNRNTEATVCGAQEIVLWSKVYIFIIYIYIYLYLLYIYYIYLLYIYYIIYIYILYYILYIIYYILYIRLYIYIICGISWNEGTWKKSSIYRWQFLSLKPSSYGGIPPTHSTKSTKSLGSAARFWARCSSYHWMYSSEKCRDDSVKDHHMGPWKTWETHQKDEEKCC